MNQEGRNHIRVNSYYLINNTDVNPNLLSSPSLVKHLGVYDSEALEKVGELKTNIDKANAFYKLIVKKKGIYNDLIEALQLEGQHGPANCLRELPEELRDVPPRHAQFIRAPEPQLPENEPNAGYQGQRVAVIAPLGQGQAQPNHAMDGLLVNETLDSDIASEGSSVSDFLR